MTVFVGPNNSGKSAALNDLNSFANRGSSNPVPPWQGGVVIDAVDMPLPSTEQEVLDLLSPRVHQFEDTYILIRAAPQGARIVSGGGGATHVNRLDVNPTQTDPAVVAARLLTHYTVALNGKQRFELAGPQQFGPLDQPPTSHWMAVERDEREYQEVDSMIFAAFNRHLILRTFRPPQIEPALTTEPVPEELRRSTSEAAIALQQASTPLDQLSDGVQVFCGLIAAIAALPHLLLLIDEPEAFLHPTLSRRLGSNLARIARERDARLFVATHSAEFLLGCLDEVPETNVIRLDYRGSVPASHALPSTEVAKLSREPLLRSANSLRALFAASAVVCEADSDRAFYEEINRRLLEDTPSRGAPDAVFLNAQNWQTTVKIAAPLRALGIPAAVILDLDTLANDTTWGDIVGMAGLLDAERDALLNTRLAARDAILERGRPQSNAPLYAKTGGLDALTDDQAAVVRSCIEKFATVGVFLVPAGELENWLSQFGCTNKQTWVTDMLQRLGTPQAGAYVPAGGDDVWAFVERVARWLENPSRLGLPTG